MSSAVWQSTLADPDVLGALDTAADRFVLDGCAHEHFDDAGQLTEDPAWCNCEENRVDPREFLEWLRQELRLSGAKPVRFEPGARPKADPPRRAKNLQLAVAI